MRTHRIVGDIDNAGTCRKSPIGCRAAQAITCMRNEVYGMYGGHSMGMETGYFHMMETQKTLGTTVYQIDQYLLVMRAQEIPQSEVDKGIKWFKEMIGDRIHWDNDMLTEETLGRQIRIYLAMKQFNEENGFGFCGLKGQRELTENYTLGDIPEMVMNDPYDWNGPKEPMVCATEADSNAALTMQLLKYITGGLPTLFMDVRLYLPDKGIWDFCNSGNHASWYAERSFDPKENFKKISLLPGTEILFQGRRRLRRVQRQGRLDDFRPPGLLRRRSRSCTSRSATCSTCRRRGEGDQRADRPDLAARACQTARLVRRVRHPLPRQPHPGGPG